MADLLRRREGLPDRPAREPRRAGGPGRARRRWPASNGRPAVAPCGRAIRAGSRTRPSRSCAARACCRAGGRRSTRSSRACSLGSTLRLYPAGCAAPRGRHPLRPGHRDPARQAVGAASRPGHPRAACASTALPPPSRSCARLFAAGSSRDPFLGFGARPRRRCGSSRPASRCTASVKGDRRPRSASATPASRPTGRRWPGRCTRRSWAACPAPRSWPPTCASWTSRRRKAHFCAPTRCCARSSATCSWAATGRCS